MRTPHQTEAVVLQAIPFKESDRILTLFSPQGLLKLFAKTKKGDYQHSALLSPLSRGEYFYSQGRSDLHRLLEGKLLSQHLALREKYETLQAAEQMILAILRSQWPGKPAPQLFQLFCLFLENLSKSQDPATFVSAFYLKILRHEGILHLQAPFEAAYRIGGDRFSKQDAPEGALFFNQEEESELSVLALSRSLTSLLDHACSVELQQKIFILFNQAHENYFFSKL